MRSAPINEIDTKSPDSDTTKQTPERVILVVDRSPVDIFRNPDGTFGFKDVPGGAGKVVAGQAAALLRQGKEVHVVAVAKTDEQRAMADANEVFNYEYDGQFIKYHYVNVPPEIYGPARDDAFSDGLWWDQQQQSHPEIRPQTARRTVEYYKEANRYVAEKVDRIAMSDKKNVLWTHDSHVARVGHELRTTFNRGEDELEIGYVHHAAMHFESYLKRLFPDPDAVKRLPLEHPMRCHYDLIESFIEGIVACDSRVFSSESWATAAKQSMEFFGIAAKDSYASAVPVPVDAGYVRARASTPHVRRLADGVRDSLKGRKLVVAGGRAEPYKQLQMFIQSEEKRHEWEAPEGGWTKDNPPNKSLTAVLTSVTRDGIGIYRDHYENEVLGEAERANHRLNMKLNTEYRNAYEIRMRGLVKAGFIKPLQFRKLRSELRKEMQESHGFEFIRIVPGNDYDLVLAHFREADVNVTIAEHEGYNLMALEQPVVQEAARLRGETDKTCVHVMNTNMGLAQHLLNLERPELASLTPAQQDVARARNPAAIFVTARVVRMTNDVHLIRAEKMFREAETMDVAIATQNALSLAPEVRTEMFEQLIRVPRENTSEVYAGRLDSARKQSRLFRNSHRRDATGPGKSRPHGSDHAKGSRTGPRSNLGARRRVLQNALSPTSLVDVERAMGVLDKMNGTEVPMASAGLDHTGQGERPTAGNVAQQLKDGRNRARSSPDKPYTGITFD